MEKREGKEVERARGVRWRIPLGQRLQLSCCGLLCVLFLCSSLTAISGSLLFGPLYFHDISLAQMGVQHLRHAQRLLLSLQSQPFDLQRIGQAQQEFSSATQIFEQLNPEVQHAPAQALSVPFVGGDLRAAQHLVPLAADFSRAGVIGCQLLQLLLKRLHDPFKVGGVALTLKDMNTISADLRSLQRLLQSGLRQLDQVQPGDLHFGKQFDEPLLRLLKYQPTMARWLGLLKHALPSLPQLLGIQQPAHYLLEVLDASELRPGGGFIGNYGLLTLQGGQLQEAHITDVDLLDLPFARAGGTIPLPTQYRWFPLAHQRWSFRDSNLDADFPTSARAGLHAFQLEGGPAPVEGLIAITPDFIQQLLAVTGPLSIPDYHETVTAQNLVERIHYYQLGAGRHGSSKVLSSDGLSSQRKHFTALLATYFFLRLHHLSEREQGQCIRLLLNSLQTKDIQLYFPEQGIEALLGQAHLAGGIERARDGLFVVDANINGNKANSFIHSTVTDVVNIDSDGNALHSLTLRYAWTTPGEIFGNLLYRDYVQIYVPTTSQLQAQAGWEENAVAQRSRRTVWSGVISLLYGDVRTVQLSWMVPHAVRPGAQGEQHFLYYVQRQAGIVRALHLQVNLPACARITGTSGGTLEHDERHAWLMQMVSRDLPLSIDYTCG